MGNPGHAGRVDEPLDDFQVEVVPAEAEVSPQSVVTIGNWGSPQLGQDNEAA